MSDFLPMLLVFFAPGCAFIAWRMWKLSIRAQSTGNDPVGGAAESKFHHVGYSEDGQWAFLDVDQTDGGTVRYRIPRYPMDFTPGT